MHRYGSVCPHAAVQHSVMLGVFRVCCMQEPWSVSAPLVRRNRSGHCAHQRFQRLGGPGCGCAGLGCGDSRFPQQHLPLHRLKAGFLRCQLLLSFLLTIITNGTVARVSAGPILC